MALVLRNAYICLNGSQTADYFDCTPLSLQIYTSQWPATQENMNIPHDAYEDVWEGEADEDLEELVEEGHED